MNTFLLIFETGESTNNVPQVVREAAFGVPSATVVLQ